MSSPPRSLCCNSQEFLGSRPARRPYHGRHGFPATRHNSALATKALMADSQQCIHELIVQEVGNREAKSTGQIDRAGELTINNLGQFLKYVEDVCLAKKAGYISCIKVGHSVFFDREQVFADLRRFQTGGPASR